MDIEEEPTPLTDPHAYLALFKFNRRLPKCLRTGVAVSYADIGAPDGIPVLFVPPSGCSRWFAAPQDPLAAGHGIRLIVVDRPGTGATPMVPLPERIDTSCQQIASVLEHLDVKPAHMLATSAGVYIALRLLSSYPDLFLTGLTPPPSVYLVSPWSPPLPATDPLSYRQLLDWIPSGVLTTQDTTIPFVFNAVRGAEEAYGATTKAVGGAVTAVKSWLGAWTSAPASPEPSTRSLQDEREDGTETELDEKAEEEAPPRRLWAPTAKYLTTEYLYAEDFRGIGQEHLLCLNRGEIDTGPAWFTTEIDAVAAAVRREQQNEEEDSCPKNRAEKEAEDKSGNDDSLQAGTEKDSSERDESEQDAELEQHPETDKLLRLPIDVWWGGLDGMVPRNGQEWLNKSFAAYPREIAFVTHFVEDGDHSDLIMRGQGVGEVYLSIMMQGHSTARE
ncbi:hypothetical protein CcaverHIS002_0104800 [Cutaneotrichosporon cavernicola]|nr:hypothetical protein CcaverHIS002_0104800 [Cutaneotrichosporon cavernicola]